MMVADVIGTLANSIGSDALSALVAAVVTAAFGVTRFVVARLLPARRTFRFKAGKNLLIVVATSAVVDTGSYWRPSTGIGQVRGLSILSPILARAYRDVDLERVRLATEVGGVDLDNDLLVLGGPKTNDVAGLLLERLASQIPLTVEGTTITWGGRKYDGVTGEDGVLYDFGYVVRAAHPMYPRRRVVIAAGSHTYGTAAAARWLADHAGSHRLPANIAVLLKVDVAWGHISTPHVIKAEPLGGE